jgi:hypothetical protein
MSFGHATTDLMINKCGKILGCKYQDEIVVLKKEIETLKSNPMTSELWKLMVNVDKNQFLISSLGRVFNYKIKKFIKPYLHKSRCGVYPRVGLGKKKYMVHILVATNFPELCPKPSLDCTQVEHDDRNTLNPAASNLRWITPSDNISNFHVSRKVTFNGETFTGSYK